MHPALLFVIYLLAVLLLLIGAVLPLFRRAPIDSVHLACLALALVFLVPLTQSGQTAF